MKINCTYAVISDINSQPKLKDLHTIITSEYAAHWKVIGTLLNIPKFTLDEINRKCPNNVDDCCNELLTTWLESDTTASWKHMIQTINSPALAAVMFSGNQLSTCT